MRRVQVFDIDFRKIQRRPIGEFGPPPLWL